MNRKNIYVKYVFGSLTIFVIFLSLSIYVLSNTNYKIITYAYLSSGNDSSSILSFPVPKFMVSAYWNFFSKKKLFSEQATDGESFLFVTNMIDGASKETIIHLDAARAEIIAKQLLCLKDSELFINEYKKYADKNLSETLTRQINAYLGNKKSYCDNMYVVG